MAFAIFKKSKVHSPNAFIARDRNVATDAENGQAAAIASTKIIPDIGPGHEMAGRKKLYRVSWYHVISQAATTSSATQLTIAWTDDTNTAQTKTGTNLNTNVLGAFDQGEFTIQLAAGKALSFSATYSSTGATVMNFKLWIVVTPLD